MSGSHLYGHLIGTGNDPNRLYWGYLLGAGAMIAGGVVAVFFAVDAEGKSLEDVARPLSAVAKPPRNHLLRGDQQRPEPLGRHLACRPPGSRDRQNMVG